MRHFAVLIASSLVACATHNSAPVASSSSARVARDTSSSGRGLAPASGDGVAAGSADARARTAPNYVDRTAGNAAALPLWSAPSASEAADNSAGNGRVGSENSLTPTDQDGSETDLELTRQIRRALVSDSSLSFTAKNVKVITLGGKVTLRGEVRTDRELKTIGSAAEKVAGRAQVDNLLEVSP